MLFHSKYLSIQDNHIFELLNPNHIVQCKDQHLSYNLLQCIQRRYDIQFRFFHIIFLVTNNLSKLMNVQNHLFTSRTNMTSFTSWTCWSHNTLWSNMSSITFWTTRSSDTLISFYQIKIKRLYECIIITFS